MTSLPRRASYGHRLLALLRRRAYAIVGFVTLMILFDATRSWSGTPGAEAFSDGLAPSVRVILPLVVAGALAPCFIEASAFVGPVARGALSIATTFLLVALVALVIHALADGPIATAVRIGEVLSNQAFLLRSWWLCSVAGLLFATYCQARDAHQDMLRALRRAELERANSQRDVLAARLQVMQARVEPELLFGALNDVRRAYLRDPVAADALLDDLIAYLRAALPRMRETRSTLEREAALAAAFLKVVPAGRSGCLRVDVRVAPGLRATPFPPMVLLPLAQAASEIAQRTITIQAPAAGSKDSDTVGSVAMRLHASTVPAGWDEEALVSVRSALHAHFGRAASVRIQADAESVSAIVTWPVSGRPRAPAVGPAAAAQA